MRNNNGASIRKLSKRGLQNNRMRNFFAVLAIALTGILFTALFSLAGGAIQAAQENTMREVGGKFHAGLKAATTEQYEKISADPMVKKSNYTIFIDAADNLIKRQAEIRYTPDESILPDMFITLEEGHMPIEADEIIADTFVLDELGLPYVPGQKIPLQFSFMGEKIEKEFTLCGWYQGDSVSHASELFVSKEYWTALKGSLTDEDFLRWKEEHPEDNGAGLIAGDLYFEKASDLEEKVRTVISNAGYEPGEELAYGVNWAYMSSRMEAADPLTVLVLGGVILVILLTGYLIIYNIFQISVISDIRFYGLLKTIGTTKRQLRRLVRRQVFMLSVAGIPIGLVVGFGIGKLVLPFMMSMADYGGMEISLQYSPWIFVFGAGFSALTVYLSSRKPGKIAGSVSPIEALRYTEEGSGERAAQRRKKKKRKDRGKFDAVSMALSNLGRNRRTAAAVITAMSLSIILLAIVATAVKSFSIEQYMDQRIAGDYLLGDNSIIASFAPNGEIEIDPEFVALADGQEGIEGKEEMWTCFRSFLQIDEKAMAGLKALDEEGKLKREFYCEEDLEKMLRGERSFWGNYYAYSKELLSNLNVLAGTLDIERFMTGDYVLLTQVQGKEMISPEENVYHPGDIVTVESFGENSTFHNITDASGMTVDVSYDNLEEKEYEVMAIVEIPYSMGLHGTFANGIDVILPLQEFKQSDDWVQLFAVSYRVEDDKQEAFEEAIRTYTEHNTRMGYTSKNILREEFEDMIMVIAVIGITLSVVIALIGILNFINAVITGIISRKREFAMLQSIGMTKWQLQKMLVCEGVSYIAVSGVVSFILGSFLSWIILKAMNNMLAFFEYHFQIVPFVVMLPMLAVVAVLAPVLAYRRIGRRSIVERLREGE